ncbi:hypothetical protein GZ78_10475 [Endozoicomonas numazuensis]|uniref:Uncharacterized protein n=1 Tax=Endozoicomonas numazuensis TaxID=1137799 RepID=A0A081NHU1_9GAMM|nr:hypothetical protein GZ78_10475 [Endozoicomonas numazuensis]
MTGRTKNHFKARKQGQLLEYQAFFDSVESQFVISGVWTPWSDTNFMNDLSRKIHKAAPVRLKAAKILRQSFSDVYEKKRTSLVGISPGG